MGDLLINGVSPDNIKYGSLDVSKVMHGAEQVWPPDASGPPTGFMIHRYQMNPDNWTEGDPGRALSIADSDSVGTLTLDQAVAARQPLLIASDPLINGHPCIESTGGSDMGTVSEIRSISNTGAQTLTVALVGKQGSVGDDSTFFDNRNNANAEGAFRGENSGDTLRLRKGTSLNSDNNVWDTDWHYWIIKWKGNATEVWQDGVRIMTGNPGAQNFDGVNIMADRDRSKSLLSGGRIAEMIFYYGGEVDITALNNYMAGKFF